MLFENRSGKNPKEVLSPSIENVDKEFWKREVESSRWGYIKLYNRLTSKRNIVSHGEMEKRSIQKNCQGIESIRL